MPTPATVSALAETTTSEINKNAKTYLSLTKAKRLPEAEKAAFRTFHRKWVDYNDRHKRTFVEADQLALWNFRKANEVFTERLAVFVAVAKTPLKPKKETSTALMPYGRPFKAPGSDLPESGRAWPILLGAGLAVAGLGMMLTRKA